MSPSTDYAKPTEVVVSAWAAREIDRLLPGERVLVVMTGPAGLLAAVDPGWTAVLAESWQAAGAAGGSR
jgi:hypothetical protein